MGLGEVGEDGEGSVGLLQVEQPVGLGAPEVDGLERADAVKGLQQLGRVGRRAGNRAGAD